MEQIRRRRVSATRRIRTDRNEMGQTPNNGKAAVDTSSEAVPKDDRSSEAMPQDEIGRRLRAMYAEVESEAIPADLIALLEKLDAAEERDGK